MRDSRGQILLPEGATLTAASISQLIQRGIQSIDVATTESPEAREERIASERKRIDDVLPTGSGSDELEQLRSILLEVLDA